MIVASKLISSAWPGRRGRSPGRWGLNAAAVQGCDPPLAQQLFFRTTLFSSEFSVRIFVIFTLGPLNSSLNESNFGAIVKIDGFRNHFDHFELKLVGIFVIFTLCSIDSSLNESNFGTIVKIGGSWMHSDDLKQGTPMYSCLSTSRESRIIKIETRKEREK